LWGATSAPGDGTGAVDPVGRARAAQAGPAHPVHASRAHQINRRRRARQALAVVVVVASGLSVGGMVGRSKQGSGGQVGNSAESEPTVTTPATIVSGQPGAATTTATRTAAENARPGSAGWKLTDAANHGEIEGYADATSITPGQPVTLFVSTVAPTFHVEVYRMGYYHGLGARLVQTSVELPGLRQAKPTFTPGINMVEARWKASVVLATATWPEGDYLFKLVASTGPGSYVPLTVRSDVSSAPFVVINAVTTWQAYNSWGGYDLYTGLTGGGGTDYADRSREVSFDRPYALGDGAGDFLGLEYPLVSLAESLGLDVTYITDADLQRDPNTLLLHKAVFSMGHDEYYSLVMRHALEAARDQGINLAFLGANAVFRHIRFADSPLGADRREICYKSAAEDPLEGRDNADVTVDWRDPPTNDPESQLIGDYYQCNPVSADMVVVDPDNWLFAGTGVHAGQKLVGVVGTEYDRFDPTVPGPADVEILTHSPLRCQGRSDYSDATYYTAASGAGVFASGSISFVGNINPNCRPAGCNGQVLGRLMENLFAVFGAGPAGLVHPSDPARSTVRHRPPVARAVPSTGPGVSEAMGPVGWGEQE
jgi:hypothetical protein